MRKGIRFLDGIEIRGRSANVDKLYGPYESKQEAISEVHYMLREVGRTVGIIEDGKIEEYWWKSNTTDLDLVKKLSGIDEAPIDGKEYVRKDANWSEVTVPTPNITGNADQTQYVYLGEGNSLFNKVIRGFQTSTNEAGTTRSIYGLLWGKSNSTLEPVISLESTENITSSSGLFSQAYKTKVDNLEDDTNLVVSKALTYLEDNKQDKSEPALSAYRLTSPITFRVSGAIQGETVLDFSNNLVDIPAVGAVFTRIQGTAESNFVGTYTGQDIYGAGSDRSQIRKSYFEAFQIYPNDPVGHPNDPNYRDFKIPVSGMGQILSISGMYKVNSTGIMYTIGSQGDSNLEVRLFTDQTGSGPYLRITNTSTTETVRETIVVVEYRNL